MIIAGAITATTVDLARVRVIQDELRLTGQVSYRTADFSSFDGILKQFVKRLKSDIDYACFGVAGPVIGREVRATNLPWHLSETALEKSFSISRVKLINDLVATAYGLRKLPADKLISINRGSGDPNGNLGLLAAGDGLGESLIYRDESNFYPYASEGGHAAFAPTSPLEAELWAFLLEEQEPVEAEDILSFRGLSNIYRFLIARDEIDLPKWFATRKDVPVRIIELALSDKDDYAVSALDLFTDCMATEAANLALKGMTIGGVYLGGAIPKQIMTAIDKRTFRERFAGAGKMSALLQNIPVKLIIDEKTALLGAASLAVEKAGA